MLAGGCATLSGSVQSAVTRAKDKVAPALVHIRPVKEIYARGKREEVPVVGSGFVISTDGYVVTNEHVAGDSKFVRCVLFNKEEVDAEVVGTDPYTDIAVLKLKSLPKGIPAVKLGSSARLKAGESVLALGSPHGLSRSVSMGIVSVTDRYLEDRDDEMRSPFNTWIQTDAAINPGNSGGPLVDAEGAIAGINTFIVSRSGGNEGIGFAVPSNIARSVYEQIREHGRVRRGQIGVVAQSITPAMARALKLPQDWGVILADIVPRSAAEAAGLRAKDLVLSLNGKPIENARQFGVNIYQSAGQTVKIEVLRAGRKMELATAVLERPRDPDRVLSLITGEQNVVGKLGVLAVDLDERVTPLLPSLRRLEGVVVAGRVSDVLTQDDALRPGDVIYEVNHAPVTSLATLKSAIEGMKHGDAVVLHIERGGQLQFQVIEIE